MANSRHIIMLRQGVKTWNQWREDKPEIIPDFSGANLSKAYFSKAYLVDAYFIEANITKANFSGVDFNEADLSGANFSEANLSGANLSGANLSGANLSGANLSGANLSRANLSGANLNSTNCYKANLSEAQLSVARLTHTNLDGVTLSGAYLWETQRAEWSIKGVICDYVYWDERRKEKTVYSLGEFERLYADKPRVRLIYKDGVDPLEIVTLPALIQHLEASHPECKLRFQSIEDASGGAIVTLVIDDVDELVPEHIGKLKHDIKSESERHIYQLRQSLAAKGELVHRLNGQLESLQWTIREIIGGQKPTYYLEKGDIQMGSIYNVNQAGAVGDNASGSNMTFNQVMNHFDLHALSKQLAELREEMAKRQDSSPQAAIAQGEAAKAEVAAKEGNTSKVAEYLKAGGQGLLDIAKETGKELLTAAIKTSMGMQ